VNNKLIRFNNWLDKNETFKFIFMILFVGIGVINIQLGSFMFGIMMLSMLCLFAINRIFIVDGRIEFDKTKYDIPKVGETAVIKKEFYWNGLFHKYCPKTDMSSKPWYFTIRKGDEWVVVDVKELDSDWVIYLSDSKDSINIRYFESKDYWETKSSIRNKKLNKLGL
jgi:hypothetical protein